MRKSFWIGGRQYILPFLASHCWVEDARANNVCEAYSHEVAKALAKLLNEEAEKVVTPDKNDVRDKDRLV